MSLLRPTGRFLFVEILRRDACLLVNAGEMPALIKGEMPDGVESEMRTRLTTVRTARRKDAEAIVDLSIRRRWFADEGQADGQNGQGNQGDDPQNAGGEKPPEGQGEMPTTWEEWLAAQPEAERAKITKFYETKTGALKGALDKEREQREGLETDLRKLAKGQKDGSEPQKELERAADELALANRRADFFQAASSSELGLVDVVAAWTLMSVDAESYFDRKGAPNFELLKQKHPALFVQPKPMPKGNGGAGTGSIPENSNPDMNKFIRQSAGYQT